jgi:hypothetical protein
VNLFDFLLFANEMPRGERTSEWRASSSNRISSHAILAPNCVIATSSQGLLLIMRSSAIKFMNAGVVPKLESSAM